MPQYTFDCNDCKNKFEITCWICEYDACIKLLECPKCNSRNVQRDYITDKTTTSIILADDKLKLGELAKRNTERMSDEEKAALNYKHNEYLYNEPEHDLPSGMKRTRKKPDGYIPVQNTPTYKKRTPRRRNNEKK